MRPVFVQTILESINRTCIDDFFRQTVPSINSPHCIEVTPQSGAITKFLQFTTMSPGFYTTLICLDKESAAAGIVHIMQVFVSFNGISTKDVYTPRMEAAGDVNALHRSVIASQERIM
jgi:hypothetical protein